MKITIIFSNKLYISYFEVKPKAQPKRENNFPSENLE